MKNEVKCVVYYVMDTESRVRIFRSEESMDRWIRKFKREHANDNPDESWLELTVVGAGQTRVHSNSVKLIRED